MFQLDIASRTGILIAVALVLLVASLSILELTQENDYSCDSCNVVYISVDPLRADHMGVYGYERNTTPNIDKLAEDSYVFNRAFSQSGHTMPSLYSTFSSTYPMQHGVYPGSNVEDSPGAYSKGQNNFTMLAELLDRRGYRTISLNGGANIRGDLGFKRGFDDYKEAIDSNRSYMSKKERYEYMKNRLESSDRKFFLFYQSFRTHDPYFVSDKYSSLFGPDLPEFRNESRRVWLEMIEEHQGSGGLYKNYRKYYFGKGAQNSTIREYIKSQYDGSVRRSDDFIGRLIELLKEEGEYENTIIIVNSQHGELLYEHDTVLHDRALYNEVIRVPLIIHLPGQGKQQSVNQYVENIDLTPTMLDLTQREVSVSDKVESQWEGTSLEPVLNREEIDKQFILAERQRKEKAFIDLRSKIKYYNATSGREFYNLEKDFDERKPLENSSQTLKVRKRFEGVYEDLKTRSVSINGSWPYFG